MSTQYICYIFPLLLGKCQGKTRKDGIRSALPKLVLNFFIVTYVPFSVFCVLFVCKCVLYSYCFPLGVNPIAVKYISYIPDDYQNSKLLLSIHYT
jgi:hypothetical protein